MAEVFLGSVTKIELKGKCITSFRTVEFGRNLFFEYETEDRDYDTVYRLKCKETHSVWPERKIHFIQARRIY